MKRRYDFIRQFNNATCYFRRLTSSVKYKLFCSYCSSFYGCELRCLSSDKIDSICATCRESVRRICDIPQHTYCNLLPLICNCLPVIDEFCRRQVNFVKSCLSHQYNITRFLSLQTAFYARVFSPLGQNVAFCTSKYNLALYELLNLPIRQIIISHLNQSMNIEVCRAASFVLDLLFIRESSSSRINRPNTTDLSYDDVQSIIDYICTN
jgi:hypothetical protein